LPRERECPFAAAGTTIHPLPVRDVVDLKEKFGATAQAAQLLAS
jgi:hypothetical protein